MSNQTNQAVGVKETVLNRAISMLTALKTEFVIKTSDGEYIKLGGLEIQEPKSTKRTRRNPDVPHGTYTKYLAAYGLEQMQIGDVLVIPDGGYGVETIRGSLSSRACKLWGNGSATTAIVGDSIEVMRIS